MKTKLLWAALFTLLVFPLIGLGVLYFFRDYPVDILLRSRTPLLWQSILGIALGTALGFAAKWLVSRPFLKETEKKYARIIAGLRLTEIEIIFISLCAGFGEELLFRGAIQPLFGIWPTALIFVAIHGYLDPRNWRISIYGGFMTLAIAALGYFTELAGIVGACLAHSAIDYVLFRHLISTGNEPSYIQTTSDEGL